MDAHPVLFLADTVPLCSQSRTRARQRLGLGCSPSAVIQGLSPEPCSLLGCIKNLPEASS